MTSLMRSVLQRDFDVEHVYSEGKISIFAKLRKNIWHFVCATSTPGNNISVGQRHIPRYSLACAVKELREMGSLTPEEFHGEMLCSPALECLGIRKKDRFDIDLFVTKNGLPVGFGKSLYCDIDILNNAKAKVKYINGEYVLPRSKTFKGHPISSSSISLVEAIAFERELNGKLDVKKIGIYSYYCTWRDYCVDTSLSLENVREHIDIQFQFDSELVEDEELMALAMQLQRNYFSSPIWGKGISVEKDVATQILGEALARLSSVQIAQFHMMNKLHGFDLFATLATVTGMLSFKGYTAMKTQDFEPESVEEQLFRTEVAYIKLFGELAIVERSDKVAGIPFEESQHEVGNKYFMYVIDSGAHVSCFFWYSSSKQLLDSIMHYMDFWSWGNGSEEALEDLSKIILKHPDAFELSKELQHELSDYMEKNAGLTLYSWGKFDDLCNGDDPFCEEIRSDFRTYVAETGEYVDEEEEDTEEREKIESIDDDVNASKPISDNEFDSFCDYLLQIPQ